MNRSLFLAASLGSVLLTASSADAQLFSRFRARAGEDPATNPYVAPDFAPADGQRIRIFRGDGSFLNRYYDQRGQNYTDDGRGVGGYKAYGDDMVQDGERWLDKVRQRRSWGSPGEGETTRRIGDGFLPLLKGEKELPKFLNRNDSDTGESGEGGGGLLGRLREAMANGDGSRLRNALMMAGAITSGVATGLASSSGYSGGGGGGYQGQDLSGALRRAQSAYNVRKQN